MTKLLVKWRASTNTDGTVSIFTEGKWGGENTPQLIATVSDRNVAGHIVELHNQTLK